MNCALCSVFAEVSVLAGMQRTARKDGLEAWVRVRAVGELSVPRIDVRVGDAAAGVEDRGPGAEATQHLSPKASGPA